MWLCFGRRPKRIGWFLSIRVSVGLAAFQYTCYFILIYYINMLSFSGVCCAQMFHRIFLCSADVNAGNTMRGSDMRVRVSVFVYVRSVKIRHSCNFPVVSRAINQADAWLRQEDGFCVVFILFCLSCRSLASPHLTHSLTQPLSGFSFFASLAITSSISKFIECKMLKRNVILKAKRNYGMRKTFLRSSCCGTGEVFNLSSLWAQLSLPSSPLLLPHNNLKWEKPVSTYFL